MDNVIRLEFEKSLSGLAGYDFGLAVYYEQIEKKVNLEGKNIVVFPDNVQRVASSFTQGLFAEIVKKIGYDGVEKKIEIRARTKELEYRIYEDLIF